MRSPFTRLLANTPPEIFSFMGGAAFAIAVDLIREWLRLKKFSEVVLVGIIVCFLLATIGFASLSAALNSAHEHEEGTPHTDREIRARIRERFTLLIALLCLTLILVLCGAYLIFVQATR